MANPDQKTILIEQAYDEIKVICSKFQEESGATDMEVKTLLRELARVWEKDINDDKDIGWEVQIIIFYVVLVRDSDLNTDTDKESYVKKHILILY